MPFPLDPFLAAEIDILSMLPDLPMRKGAHLISENHREHRFVHLRFHTLHRAIDTGDACAGVTAEGRKHPRVGNAGERDTLGQRRVVSVPRPSLTSPGCPPATGRRVRWVGPGFLQGAHPEKLET